MAARSSIADELRAAEPRPSSSASREKKKNYAERLSRALASKVANALRKDFPGITPDEHGAGHEKPARAAKGPKKLDVNYSTPELGLGLGVSIKTLNFRDAKTKRFTKNYGRIDNELRAEAMDYHVRQPFSVLAALIFLPIQSCDDGKQFSSFGAAVRSFRHRADRSHPKNEEQLFERVFIGLYDTDGRVGFFDVMEPPPRLGRPAEQTLLSFSEVIRQIKKTYDDRNDPPFTWAE